MTSKQHKRVVFAAIPALAAAGVILDLFTRLGIAAWFFLMMARAALGQAADQFSATSPVLTNISQIWSVPREHNTEEHQIRVEAVIYYYGKEWNAAWGECAGKPTWLPILGSPVPFKAGQRIAIDGWIVPSRERFVWDKTQVRILQEGVNIKAEPVGNLRDNAAGLKGHLVSVEGLIDRQLNESTHITLSFLNGDTTANVYVLLKDANDPAPGFKEGDFVRMKCVYSPQFDRDGKLNVLSLWVAHPKDIEAIGSLRNDRRFVAPITPICEIQESTATNNMVRVAGIVHSHEQGKWVTIWDGTGQVMVQSRQTQPLRSGDRVEAIGYPYVLGVQQTLHGGLYRLMASTNELASFDNPPFRVVEWIRDLNREEARRHSPVILRAVVTWSHPETTFTFVQDASGGSWNGELTCRTRLGQEVTVETRLTLVRDNLGNPKSILAISTDVTEKKKLEVQFLRAQRMESLGTLAGGIAHDLNNVLTPLLVSVEVLKEKITDADGQRLLAALETNVQRGSSLVKQVLAFGRGTTGERVTVHPKYVAHEIKQIVHETFPKSVGFELHSAADLWIVTGDPTQLHQVLLNLCVNARDAMPNGGKLSIHMKNVVLDEASASLNPEAKPGPHVLIEVADTGTGIPKEIQDKIFDPFFTTKEPGKGTGLGLSTALVIVKSHGGFINCYSEPGKGTTFKVYLPANTAPVVAENAAVKESRLPRGHNELVLVVDDEEPILNLAQRVLERFGYRVLLAANGTEALSFYAPRRNEIDVVITDMLMPGMDGLATIVALRDINPEVKIVASSGLASDGAVAKAMDAGIRYFIPKPYTAEAILNTLQEVLNGKH